MSPNYGNEISVNGINCLYRFSDNFHDHTFPLCPIDTFGSFGSPHRRRRTCQEGGSARRRSRTGTGRSAYLGTRPFYRHKKWVEATLWKMESLKAGNYIVGPAIIESDATTFVVPDGFETTIDKHRLFHLKEVK